MADLETRLLSNPDLIAQIEDAIAHPERRRPRPDRAEAQQAAD